MEKYILNNFALTHPEYYEKYVCWVYIGEMEYIFYLNDNNIVLYDSAQDSCRMLTKESPFKITEQEWRDEFSRKLRKKMRIKYVGISDISQATGITERRLSRLLRAEVSANCYTVLLICDFFNCQINELSDFTYLIWRGGD